MRAPLRRAGAVLALSLPLVGCAQGGLLSRLFRHAPPPSPTEVHYVVGAPYQAGGVWRYPRESFDEIETGLAVVYGPHGRLTTDGEVFDQTALTAGHPALQLPAVARITNLETGRQVLVRINDRGPTDAGRAVVVTTRTATLLGAAPGRPFRMRLQVEENDSRRLAALLDRSGPLPIASAPLGGVAQESLAPPPGARQAPQIRVGATRAPVVSAAVAEAASVPLRLAETVTQGPPQPGGLYVMLGAVGRPEYAEMLRRRTADLGARISTHYDAPRDRAFDVTVGPLTDVAEADAMLVRARRDGVADPRIIVQ